MNTTACRRFFFHALLPLLVLLTAPIAARAADAMRPEDVHQSPEAAAHYKAHPEFYHFATPADLPADIVWQTNDTDPEFASPEAKRGGAVTFVIATYPPTLRQIGPNANSSFRSFIYDNYQILLTIGHPNTDKPIPGTATHWAISADRKTVYYKLNPAVRFTDGQPVTADDYFFTFYFHTSPHTKAPWYIDYYSREFAGITKFDDYTIAISLPDERPDPIYFTSIEPTPRQFFKEFGPDFVVRYQNIQHPIVGPYYVNPEKIVVEQSITLDRVSDWWGDKQRYFRHRYNLDHITYRVVRDPTKAFEMFLIGDVDFMEIRMPKFWYRLNNEQPFRQGYIEKSTFFYDRPCPTWGLFLNSIKPGLDDHNVRIGIQHATDWQRVINTFYRGDYQRLNSFTEGFGKFTDTSIKARPYDPAAAMRHFAAAGFTRRGSDGILVNPDTGARLSFQLTTRDTEERKFIPTLVDSARKAGLEFRPEALEPTTFFKKTTEKKHDISFLGWNIVNKYPSYWEGFHIDNAIETKPDGTVVPKRQTNNITSTQDKELSALIDKCRDAKSDAEVQRLGFEIQRRVHEDASFVPGYKVVTYRIVSWRWIRFAPEFGMKNSDDIFETGTFWMDADVKQETKAAQAAGKAFPQVVRINDQYNTER
ncbi:MAG: ABC transporter substrate-binding protein [Puniceicoccales bacterium]|jgi:microcin C transport system substrate-binding protein|nr:ABC transporter substrate-binding protein [Puniceicoccales bacterium]